MLIRPLHILKMESPSTWYFYLPKEQANVKVCTIGQPPAFFHTTRANISANHVDGSSEKLGCSATNGGSRNNATHGEIGKIAVYKCQGFL